MATPTLEAEAREKLGTKYSRRLRSEGKLPAVIYGNKSEPTHIVLNNRNFVDVLKTGATEVELKYSGKSEVCTIKDIQFDHLGDTIIHADLTRA